MLVPKTWCNDCWLPPHLMAMCCMYMYNVWTTPFIAAHAVITGTIWDQVVIYANSKSGEAPQECLATRNPWSRSHGEYRLQHDNWPNPTRDTNTSFWKTSLKGLTTTQIFFKISQFLDKKYGMAIALQSTPALVLLGYLLQRFHFSRNQQVPFSFITMVCHDFFY